MVCSEKDMLSMPYQAPKPSWGKPKDVLKKLGFKFGETKESVAKPCKPKEAIGHDYWENRLKERIREDLDKVDKAMRRGASSKEIDSLMEQAIRPNDFHECIGGLVMSSELIFPIIINTLSGKDDVDKDTSRYFWNDFVKHQKYCDDFFFGCEMRTYVIARAWKQTFNLDWDAIDMCLKAGSIDVDLYRKEDWWRVACFQYLAAAGHEEREVFQAAWVSMTGDQRIAVIESLSSEEILNFKLQD